MSDLSRFGRWLTNWWPLIWRVACTATVAYMFLLEAGMPQVWNWQL